MKVVIQGADGTTLSTVLPLDDFATVEVPEYRAENGTEGGIWE
jgi:hypothetical protein